MNLERHACVRIELLDASPMMLDQARRRLGGSGNVTFVRGDMGAAAFGGPWDLIVLALAIHHLADGEKVRIFERVRGALTPSGLFVNAEQVREPTDAAEELYARRWLRDVRAVGVPRKRGRAGDRADGA